MRVITNPLDADNERAAEAYGLNVTGAVVHLIQHDPDMGWMDGDYQLLELADGSVYSWVVGQTNVWPALTWCPLPKRKEPK